MEIAFPVLCIVLLLVFFVYQERKMEEQKWATFTMCDASEAFSEWYDRNPGVYIGLSDEGRKLVSAYLESYDEFLRTHSYVDGSEHREWIVNLFNDLPPKTPHSHPKAGKGVRKDVLFAIHSSEILTFAWKCENIYVGG